MVRGVVHLRRSRRGMTLIEVLIALALLLALAGVSLRFVAMVGQARSAAAEREGRLWGGGLLMEHLERDLLTAFAGDGAAIAGDAQSISITGLRFEGETPRLIASALRLDADAGAVVVSVGGGAWEGGDSGRDELLVDGVRWWSLRYLDGKRWVESTEGMDGRAPRAVEVSVWFGWVDEEMMGKPARPADRRRLVPVFGADDGDDALAQRAVGSSGLSRSSVGGAS